MRCHAMWAGLAVLLIAAPLAGQAATLTLGVSAEPAIDPHFLFAGSNIAISHHLFGSLTERDTESRIVPGLATSWRPIDATTWEFRLRSGVTYHDGTPFRADDVAASMVRIATLPNNPNPYTTLIRSVSAVEAIDATTLRLHTAQPDPGLPSRLADVFIIPEAIAKTATTEAFRSGKAVVGTGPYQFNSYRPGDRLELRRNDAYWGTQEPWNQVVIRMVPNAAARFAGLRSGDLDAVDMLDPVNETAASHDTTLAIFKHASDTIVYLILDVARARTPEATDASGQVLARNPLQDIRVRQAISMAINRDAIARRLLEDWAEPAGQLAPTGILGFNPTIPPPRFDAERARSLLTEAGYPDGFHLVLNGPTDRYLDATKVLEAIGQMLARIGVRVEVNVQPFNVYFSRIRVRPDLEGLPFSAMLVGWSNSAGDTGDFLATVLHSYDVARGLGTGNRSGYRDSALDTLIEKANRELNQETRVQHLQSAMTLAMQALTTVPLYAPYVVTIARTGFNVTPRADGALTAMSLRPAK